MAQDWISIPAKAGLAAAAVLAEGRSATHGDVLQALADSETSEAGEILRSLRVSPNLRADHPEEDWTDQPLLCGLQMAALRRRYEVEPELPVDTVGLILTIVDLDPLALLELGIDPAEVLTAAARAPRREECGPKRSNPLATHRAVLKALAEDDRLTREARARAIEYWKANIALALQAAKRIADDASTIDRAVALEAAYVQRADQILAEVRQIALSP